MKKNRKKISKKTLIKKIKRYVKGLTLLLPLIIGTLYIIFIMIMSLCSYLYNRPIKTGILCGVIGFIMITIETIQENKAKLRAKQTNK